MINFAHLMTNLGYVGLGIVFLWLMTTAGVIDWHLRKDGKALRKWLSKLRQPKDSKSWLASAPSPEYADLIRPLLREEQAEVREALFDDGALFLREEAGDRFRNLANLAPILGTIPTISGVIEFLPGWGESLKSQGTTLEITPLMDALLTTLIGLTLSLLALVAARCFEGRIGKHLASLRAPILSLWVAAHPENQLNQSEHDIISHHPSENGGPQELHRSACCSH